jgi:GLPGLI family protein
MKKIVLSAALVVSALFANAQKEGSITYSMNIEGLPEEQAAMMKGMEMKVYFKNGKSRSETSMAFGTTTTVTDDKGNGTMLMEMMGQKQFMKMSAEDAKKEEAKMGEPKITYSEEKKTVAGYECKKAVIDFKDEKGTPMKSDVWYTDKIPYTKTGSRGAGQFKGLKGAPLEFSMNQQGMKINVVATNVNMAPVADSKFVLNTDGYTEIKQEDLKKMQGAK